MVLEAIADPTDRVNKLRPGRVRLDLLAQPADMHVDRSVGAGKLTAPYPLEQQIARQGHAGIMHQAGQQIEFSE